MSRGNAAGHGGGVGVMRIVIVRVLAAIGLALLLTGCGSPAASFLDSAQDVAPRWESPEDAKLALATVVCVVASDGQDPAEAAGTMARGLREGGRDITDAEGAAFGRLAAEHCDVLQADPEITERVAAYRRQNFPG